MRMRKAKPHTIATCAWVHAHLQLPHVVVLVPSLRDADPLLIGRLVDKDLGLNADHILVFIVVITVVVTADRFAVVVIGVVMTLVALDDYIRQLSSDDRKTRTGPEEDDK